MSNIAHFLVVQVETPKKFSRKRLCKLPDRLIQIGLEDSAESDESDDADLAVIEAIEVLPAQ